MACQSFWISEHYVFLRSLYNDLGTKYAASIVSQKKKKGGIIRNVTIDIYSDYEMNFQLKGYLARIKKIPI